MTHAEKYIIHLDTPTPQREDYLSFDEHYEATMAFVRSAPKITGTRTYGKYCEFSHFGDGSVMKQTWGNYRGPKGSFAIPPR